MEPKKTKAEVAVERAKKKEEKKLKRKWREQRIKEVAEQAQKKSRQTPLLEAFPQNRKETQEKVAGAENQGGCRKGAEKSRQTAPLEAFTSLIGLPKPK